MNPFAEDKNHRDQNKVQGSNTLHFLAHSKKLLLCKLRNQNIPPASSSTIIFRLLVKFKIYLHLYLSYKLWISDSYDVVFVRNQKMYFWKPLISKLRKIGFFIHTEQCCTKIDSILNNDSNNVTFAAVQQINFKNVKTTVLTNLASFQNFNMSFDRFEGAKHENIIFSALKWTRTLLLVFLFKRICKETCLY